MTIAELKRALVEVRELCAISTCMNCVLSKRDEANVPYCPLIEDEDGFKWHEPSCWDIDDWEEDTNESQAD